MGPCSYGTPEPNSGERYITADSSNEPTKSISVNGPLDMKQTRITNMREPRSEETDDATTVGYVHRWVSSVYNSKVDWRGGTMTGPLSMGHFKLTDVGNPTDETDCVNKLYVDSRSSDLGRSDLNMNNFKITDVGEPENENDVITKGYFDEHLNIYNVGRYIVFPSRDKKVYFSVRTARNIDLDNGLIVNLKNEQILIDEPQNITVNQNITYIPIPRKFAGIMQLNTPFSVRFQALHHLPKLLQKQTYICLPVYPGTLTQCT